MWLAANLGFWNHPPHLPQDVMRTHLLLVTSCLGLFVPAAHAAIKISAEASERPSPAFQFKTVPAPVSNDAASQAEFTLLAGERDPNGAELTALQDGRLPQNEDQPAQNFFFRAGSEGGRLRIDLRQTVSIQRISTYSWHGGNRAAQVYRLYASDGERAGFTNAPAAGVDPEKCGWRQLASVDTRKALGNDGGQLGVAITDSETNSLGRYRYLLLDVMRTEDRDAFGNTFYSEVDVMDANGPVPTALAAAREETPILSRFDAAHGVYQFTIDATSAPDLMEWAERELKPVVQEWYPKLVQMLPSDGFEAPTNITLRFRNDMRGTPASAGGGRINMNSDWFRRELKREARGSVVHEMVHVVQSYGRARRTNPDAPRMPGWLVEGIPDYIRWFIYEPETKGAEITARNLSRAKYDASYRITGNFLNWVTQTYDRDLVRKLNTAGREGKYSEQLWKDLTGKTVEELGELWKKAHETRLAQATADPTPPE